MRQKTALVLTMVVVLAASTSMAGEIIHDAEQQILEEQFGEQWAAQDVEIQKKLDELYAKYGKRPNIVHIMWDDNSFGEVGIPVMNKIRGYDTPHLNKMGQDGIVFTRMYTEPSCTPTRATALTGRLAVRQRHVYRGLPTGRFRIAWRRGDHRREHPRGGHGGQRPHDRGSHGHVPGDLQWRQR